MNSAHVVAPVAALGVAVAMALLRRRLRSRRQTGQSRRRRAASNRTLFGDTGLVAAREIRERLRGRFFRVVTLVLLAVVGTAIVIPALRHQGTAQVRIGVVGQLTPPLRTDAVRAAQRAGVTVDLVDEPNKAHARAQLRDGQVAAVIVGARQLLVKTAVSDTDTTTTARATRVIASSIGVANALRAAQLRPTQVAVISEAHPLPVVALSPGAAHTTALTTSMIGVVLIFIMLSQYLTWTLMGVMEEKSSRVVEVLLAAVRPMQLLGGKVLGIGAVAMAQACLVVAFALVLARLVGSSVLHGTSPVVIAASLAWLVLGYAFYSWVYAAAGSMVERQDQVQSLALPLSVPMIVGYVVALIAAGSAHPSLLVEVLAFVPPTAPFAMPTLVAIGAATWWWFALSVVVSVVSTLVVARLAAAVYRRAVLRTGRTVRIKDLVTANR